MASNSFNISTGNQYISGYVLLQESNPSDYLVTNKSILTATAFLRRTNAYSGTPSYVSSATATFVIFGETFTIDTGKITIPNDNSYVQIASASKEITHNDDGTSPNISVSFALSNPYSNASFIVPSTTGYITLDTIPRTTPCPMISGYIESSAYIPLNPASANFYHRIYIKFGTIEGYLNAIGDLQSTIINLSSFNPIFNIPKTFYSQFSGLEAYGTITLYTYSGDTLIGTSSNTLIVYINQTLCQPKIIGSVEDINEVTLALTNNKYRIIKGWSNVLITPTIIPSSANDTFATVSKKYIDNVEFSTDTVTIIGAIKKDFNISATNSRAITNNANLPTSDYESTILVDYVPLTFDALFSRTNPTSDDLFIQFNGNYFDDYFDAEKENHNSLTITWKVRPKNTGEFVDGGVFTLGEDSDYIISNNKFTSNGKISLINPLSDDGKWAYNKRYDFIIAYSDSLNSLEYKYTSTGGKPIYDWYEKSDGTNVFNVNGEIQQNRKCIFPIGFVYISVENIDPSTWLGGTWERIKDVFLLCAGDIYNAGSTGGKSEVTLTIDNIPYHYHTYSGNTETAGSHSHTGNTLEIKPGTSASSYDLARPITSSADHYGLTITNESGEHQHSYSGNTSSVGSNKAFSIMPPHLAVYAWRRIK